MSVNYAGHNIPVALRPKRPKLSLIEDQDNIKISIYVEMEGDIEQTYFAASENMLDIKFVKEIENAMDKKTEQRAKNAINKIQKEFETDVLGIDRYLRQFHPKLWKDVKEDWQEIFPNIDIDINMDIKIRRIGLSK